MNALDLLYGQLRKAKLAHSRAEMKNNPKEVADLKRKIEALDWLIAVAIKED